jgi:hypothetical protein
MVAAIIGALVGAAVACLGSALVHRMDKHATCGGFFRCPATYIGLVVAVPLYALIGAVMF